MMIRVTPKPAAARVPRPPMQPVPAQRLLWLRTRLRSLRQVENANRAPEKWLRSNQFSA